MNGRMQFVLVILLVGMSFFAGYGFGKQENAPKADQAATEEKKQDSHGHGNDKDGKASMATDAVWSTENARAGERTTVRIHIQDEKKEPVQNFEINHEKLLHLIVVSKDLSYFDHIHPEYKGSGEFEIATTFPAGGDYKLIADYVPAGGGRRPERNGSR